MFVVVVHFSEGESESKTRKMVHWSCSSSLCFNNYKTVNEKGESIKCYRLPREKSIQAEYRKFFKSSGFNWNKGYICASHWSSGERKSSSDLPDVAVPKKQYDLLKLKYQRAKKTYQSSKKPTDKQTLAFKNAKRKLTTAMKIFSGSPVKRHVRKSALKRSTPRKIIRREPSKLQYKRKLENSFLSNEELQSKLTKAEQRLAEMQTELGLCQAGRT